MDDIRVSTIELFFDLVFVFTITQLTNVLVAEPNAVGVARVVLIFGNVWWMYGGYAWLTNAVPPHATQLRLLMLVAMGGFLIVALAIPDAFGASAIAFGVGYLIVTIMHAGLFMRSTQESAVRAMTRLGPFNLATAGVLLAAGFVHGGWRWSLWVAGFVLHWASPVVTAVGGFRIRAPHVVERHGLILLIAIGESVVAVGLARRGHGLPAGVIVVALLGLALAAALWWLFFDGEDERAERSLDAAPDARNPWLALYAFGYAFLPVLGGIIVAAAGVKRAVEDYSHRATAATAWFLAVGAAVYLLGLVAFRAILRTGPLQVRVVLAAASLATVPVGLLVTPELQLAALAVIVAVGIAIEPRLPALNRSGG
jgi:low temperature requirement protein LtrA